MRSIYALAVIGTVLGAPAAIGAPAKDADTAAPMMTIETPMFIGAVKSAGLFEIKSSELAKQKSSDAVIKAFAEQMIADHTKAGERLKKAAGEKDGKPVDPAPKQDAMLKLLEDANGPDFDMLYVDMQAAAHMEAVSLFRTYAGSGDNARVKAFAKETLPTLEMHLLRVKIIVASH